MARLFQCHPAWLARSLRCLINRWPSQGVSYARALDRGAGNLIFGAQCVLDFDNVGPTDTCEVQPNELFAGCFEGLVTDAVDGGKVKIILSAADDLSNQALTGCVLYSLADISEEILLAGETACMPSQRPPASEPRDASTSGGFPSRPVTNSTPQGLSPAEQPAQLQANHLHICLELA